MYIYLHVACRHTLAFVCFGLWGHKLEFHSGTRNREKLLEWPT